MPHMSPEHRTHVVPRLEAPASDVTPVLDHLRRSHTRLSSTYPNAALLYADCLTAGRDVLRGSFESARGTHGARVFRDMWAGLRALPCGDLCRMATESDVEREAAQAFVEKLLRRLGRRSVPLHGMSLKDEVKRLGALLDRLEADPVFLMREP
jgi:hypothetical protein